MYHKSSTEDCKLSRWPMKIVKSLAFLKSALESSTISIIHFSICNWGIRMQILIQILIKEIYGYTYTKITDSNAHTNIDKIVDAKKIRTQMQVHI